jgi:nucleolar MIF4G domain-containing protein 1
MVDVTTMITDLVLQAISSKANLLDSFVSLYAVFVGALHRIIGVEFGESTVSRL